MIYTSLRKTFKNDIVLIVIHWYHYDEKISRKD